MKETNDYGMYSGGYIFDQMDRAALEYVKMEAKLPDRAVIVTMAVDGLRYKKQLCDKYAITVHCYDFHKVELFSVLYCCSADIIDNKGDIVAEAHFTFTEATNHCELVYHKTFDYGDDPLDNRAVNCLKGAKIKTVGEITRLTKKDILNMPGAGRKTLNRIQAFLGTFGLSLKPDKVTLQL